MKRLVVLAVVLALFGCDYTVQLAETPETAIDKAAVGLWQRMKEDGQTEGLLVLPLNKREYLVSFPAGSRDAMFARACLCKVRGKTFAQLQWLGTARGKLPKDGRVFQFAAYSVTGDTLRFRMVNADLVQRSLTSTAALAKAIVDKLDNPALFRGEMAFQKVKN